MVRIHIGTALIFAGFAVSLGCSDGGSSSNSSSVVQNYSGPGSNWSSTLNPDGTFTLAEADSSVAIGAQGYAVDIRGIV